MPEAAPSVRSGAEKSFTALKLAALDSAASDERLTHFDFRLFYYLASASDRETGVARRKQQVIADALGVTRRGVQLSAQRLAEAGYIIVILKDGGSYTHGYKIMVRKENASSSFEEVKVNAASPMDRNGRTAKAKHANERSERGEPPFAPILPLKSLDIPSSGQRLPEVVVAHLKEGLGNDVFSSWFGRITVSGVSAGVVTMFAPSTYIARQIINHYERHLLKAWRALDPCVKQVTARVDPDSTLP